MRLQCKIFYGRNRKALEEQVNRWLNNHVVKPDMRFQYSQSIFDDGPGYGMDCTLVLFYTPIFAEGKAED